MRGLFQEGSYCGPGGDMDELKDYLLGRLMFDQLRNDTDVIDTFVSNFRHSLQFGPNPGSPAVSISS